MTIEEKAIRYDEVKNKLSRFIAKGVDPLITRADVQDFFPELKESEDDKIRKEIIDFLKLPHPQFVGKRDHEKWIAWIEKQGLKSNPYSGVSFNYNGNTWGMCARDNGVDILFNMKLMQHISDEKQETFGKKDVDDAYLKGVRDTKNEIEKQYEANYQTRKDIATFIFNYRGDIKDRAKWMDYLGIKVSFVGEQGEQKVPVNDFKAKDWYVSKVDGKIHNIYHSVDKVEPKFHEGDFIKHNKANIICKVISVNSGSYYVENIETSGRIELFNARQNFHLWTLEDAKDGDVLAGSHGTFILMGKSNGGYCGVLSDNTFIRSTGNNEWTEDLHPATKEQRDLLSQKMKEAGYTFDFENKEIKNIEQKAADKAEPKFEIGDWVINRTNAIIMRIINNKDFYESVEIGGQRRTDSYNYADWDFRLWTIQDAKDGDVLISDYEGGICIAILKSVVSSNEIEIYCHLINSELFIAQSGFSNAIWHPATKEQRDLFFQKMKEAGWEWDAETKELRKFEQKSADTVAPKFKVGDWITNSIETVQITGYDIDYGYQVDYKGKLQHRDTDIIEKEYHLWTIQDAMDGDVLTNGKMVVIFKHFEEPSYRQHIVAYIGLDRGGDIQITDDTWRLGIDKAKPATKEQRDLLFSKMDEAGYVWDADTKELKKIEQSELTEFEEAVKDMMDDYRDAIGDYGATTEEVKEHAAYMLSLIRQKPVWSEEDEKFFKTALWHISYSISNGKSTDIHCDTTEWLKSLKERIGG